MQPSHTFQMMLNPFFHFFFEKKRAHKAHTYAHTCENKGDRLPLKAHGWCAAVGHEPYAHAARRTL
jgi:hypothetical protein